MSGRAMVFIGEGSHRTEWTLECQLAGAARYDTSRNHPSRVVPARPVAVRELVEDLCRIVGGLGRDGARPDQRSTPVSSTPKARTPVVPAVMGLPVPTKFVIEFAVVLQVFAAASTWTAVAPGNTLKL